MPRTVFSPACSMSSGIEYLTFVATEESLYPLDSSSITITTSAS